jgi:hypothetical protein
MNACRLFALSLVAAFASAVNVPAVQAESIQINSNSYAAVAYSPATRRYYYAYNYGTRYEAEQAALRGLNKWDGRVAGWVKGGFFALAVSYDGGWRTGWSYGDGASNSEAAAYSLRDFRAQGRSARVLVCLSSDGQYVYKVGY